MDVFVAIAEPNRRFLLDKLATRERSAGELVDALPSLTQPAVSRHLKVLREAGLVDVRADAQRRIYSLRPEGLVELDAWLERYRRFWNHQFDSLEAHLARLHGQPRATAAPELRALPKTRSRTRKRPTRTPTKRTPRRKDDR